MQQSASLTARRTTCCTTNTQLVETVTLALNDQTPPASICYGFVANTPYKLYDKSTASGHVKMIRSPLYNSTTNRTSGARAQTDDHPPPCKWNAVDARSRRVGVRACGPPNATPTPSRHTQPPASSGPSRAAASLPIDRRAADKRTDGRGAGECKRRDESSDS